MVQSQGEQEQFLQQLGGFIVTLRKQRGMKQVDLADALDVDVRVLRRIEKGETNIQILTVFKLADIFKVKPISFITLTEN